MQTQTHSNDMTLRNVVANDLPAFFQHQSDPEATRMALFPAREHTAFMAHWTDKVLGNPAVSVQTILEDARVAGHVLSWSQDGLRLVGYWLGRAFWGRGLASRALAAFVSSCEHARPLHAWVATGNVASLNVLRRCGFVPHGPARMGPERITEQLMRLDGAL